MARAITKQDVADNRTIYLQVIDRFVGSLHFDGPYLAQEANEIADRWKESGCQCEIIETPKWYKPIL